LIAVIIDVRRRDVIHGGCLVLDYVGGAAGNAGFAAVRRCTAAFYCGRQELCLHCSPTCLSASVKTVDADQKRKLQPWATVACKHTYCGKQKLRSITSTTRLLALEFRLRTSWPLRLSVVLFLDIFPKLQSTDR